MIVAVVGKQTGGSVNTVVVVGSGITVIVVVSGPETGAVVMIVELSLEDMGIPEYTVVVVGSGTTVTVVSNACVIWMAAAPARPKTAVLNMVPAD